MTPITIATQLEYLAKRLRSSCGNAADPLWKYQPSPCDFARQLMGLAIECEEQGDLWTKERDAHPCIYCTKLECECYDSDVYADMGARG
jgi:hypothetical protein